LLPCRIADSQILKRQKRYHTTSEFYMGRDMHSAALQPAVREPVPDSDFMDEYAPLFDLQQQLGDYLRSLLPTARLRRQTVLRENDLRLWLIDPEGMDAPLEHGEAAAVFAEPPYWCFCW